MKKRYQIDKQRAVQQFRRIAEQGDRSIQLVIPLKEVLELVQRGLMNLALRTFTQVAEEVMDHEVTALVGPKNQANPERGNVRWGSQAGYCVVGGQKIPLKRPRVRDLDKKEVSLGSYELFQRASLMEESVWKKIMHGLTTRRYSQIVEELEQAYGIRKSTISEHFIEASRHRLDKLLARPLGEYAFCAMLIDGTPFGDQQLITAMGVTVHGQKLVLGLRQGATENATVVRQLLADLRERGVDFDVPRLYVLDGGKALFAGVRQAAGKAAVVQRLNETLTIHRLRLPPLLRTSFASTNLIESAFSVVETVCRNVKRWQGGDQYLRWVGSGLIYAESRWYRVQGYRELSVLVKELELAVLKEIPLHHATVA